MPHPFSRHVATALLGLAAALPAWASSTASSASSDAGSASVGSVSTSLETSSNSATGGGRVAAGPYRIVDVAEAPARPDQLRLTLAAETAAPGAAPATVTLLLPRATAERAGLAAGGQVVASRRPYGLEFAAGQPQAPFFLVLDDDWHRGLRAQPVTL